jgi:hypothetical protein
MLARICRAAHFERARNPVRGHRDSFVLFTIIKTRRPHKLKENLVGQFVIRFFRSLRHKTKMILSQIDSLIIGN